MAADPQAAVERRAAARHLLLHPLTCKEHDPDTFRLIRRHEAVLGHWFAQRLGYRLQVTADTARLSKATYVPERRPLRTSTGRPLHQLELVTLVLVLGATIAGPPVVSLRDLVDLVRSVAAEAEVSLPADATGRRAFVTSLRWMIDQGLASELHARVDAYVEDEDADAVLQLVPDRIAMLPLPAMSAFGDAEELCARPARQDALRQWLRSRLVEDPVLYRDDLTEDEWGELRRRIGEEERYLEEMFGLLLEVRSEGVAAIDPAGSLSGRAFPAGGTVGHAALLLIEALRGASPCGPATAPLHEQWWTLEEIAAQLQPLCVAHATRWANDLVQSPDRLARAVVDLLLDVRLAEERGGGPPGAPGGLQRAPGGPPGAPGGLQRAPGASMVRLLPAAGRFSVGGREAPGADGEAWGPDHEGSLSGTRSDGPRQDALW
ncbi:MAG: TIGR02678 family protein [Actinomycetota bacterium]|nr:TIGR02678 family protein [Actinomycetota bacterium]